MSEGTSSVDSGIATAISNGTAALEAFNSSLEQLAKLAGPNGETFSFDVPLPGIHNSLSAGGVSERISSTITLLQTLATIENVVLIPDSDIADLVSRSGEIKTPADSLAANVASFSNGQPLASIDINTFIGSNSAGQTFNFGTLIAATYAPSQALLSVIRRFLQDRDRPERIGLAETLSTLASVRTDQLSAYRSLIRLKRALGAMEAAAEPKLSAIEEIHQQVETLREEAQSNRDEAQTFRNEISEALQKANTRIETIEAVGSKASELQQSVDSYASSFDQFDKSLKAREKLFIEGTEKYDSMLKANSVAQAELDRLLERARAVLGEATVSGLSGKFATETTGINTRLKFSLGLFFVGIVLFFLSAGIILDLFPWLSAWGVIQVHFKEPPTDPTLWPNVVYLLGTVVGKVVFLLPSLVLIGFSAKWYAALFRLRKEYAYKFTVAASIPGFKIESPQFADAITAIAFQELLHNPEEHQGAAAQATNDLEEKNSLLQKLLNPMVTKVVDQALARMDGQKK